MVDLHNREKCVTITTSQLSQTWQAFLACSIQVAPIDGHLVKTVGHYRVWLGCDTTGCPFVFLKPKTAEEYGLLDGNPRDRFYVYGEDSALLVRGNYFDNLWSSWGSEPTQMESGSLLAFDDWHLDGDHHEHRKNPFLDF